VTSEYMNIICFVDNFWMQLDTGGYIPAGDKSLSCMHQVYVDAHKH